MRARSVRSGLVFGVTLAALCGVPSEKFDGRRRAFAAAATGAPEVGARARSMASAVRALAAGAESRALHLAGEAFAIDDGGGAQKGVAVVAGRARAGVRLVDSVSGMSISFAPVVARDAEASVDGGLVLFSDVAEGVDLAHRPRPDGDEDFARIAAPTFGTSLAYTVSLGARVAGLRLYADTLEILDLGGIPRLRVAPPYVVDARGVRRAAGLSIAGCALDRSAAPAPGRPVTRPGAATCVLTVRWSDRGLGYPLIVDPAWTSTGALATARAAFTLSQLSAGKLLAAGGVGAAGALVSTEIYDVSSATWSAGPPLAHARSAHAAVTLGDGSVAVFGGRGAERSAERFDPVSSAWSDLAAMGANHDEPSATLVPGGDVLVVGGDAATGACERFHPTPPTGGVFSTMAALPSARAGHGAALVSGRIVVAGGRGAATAPAVSDEFDLATSAWLASNPMRSAHDRGAIVSVPAGVYAIGGIDVGGAPTTAIELRDPATGVWGGAGALQVARVGLSALALDDGTAVAVGGHALASTETFPIGVSSAIGTSPSGSLVAARESFAVVALTAGRALAVGGRDAGGGALSTAEVFGRLPLGASCTDVGECVSGRCAAGICCDGPTCASPCVTDAQCDLLSYCDAGRCAAKLANGATATSAAACTSGALADGVCCEVACVGPCEACDGRGGATAGHCAPIAGAASHGTCDAAPASADPCLARLCDGTTRERCAGYVGAAVACRARSCDVATGAATDAAQCDGSGACPVAATHLCAPFACDGDACRLSCRSSADCATSIPCDAVSHRCAKATVCIDDHTAKGVTGATRDCAPYACKNDDCLSACAAADDCTGANVCDPSLLRCTASNGPSGVATGGAGGCAVGARGSRIAPVDAWGIVGVACAACAARVVRRRRRAVGARRPLL